MPAGNWGLMVSQKRYSIDQNTVKLILYNTVMVDISHCTFFKNFRDV